MGTLKLRREALAVVEVVVEAYGFSARYGGTDGRDHPVILLERGDLTLRLHIGGSPGRHDDELNRIRQKAQRLMRANALPT